MRPAGSQACGKDYAACDFTISCEFRGNARIAEIRARDAGRILALDALNRTRRRRKKTVRMVTQERGRQWRKPMRIAQYADFVLPARNKVHAEDQVATRIQLGQLRTVSPA